MYKNYTDIIKNINLKLHYFTNVYILYYTISHLLLVFTDIILLQMLRTDWLRYLFVNGYRVGTSNARRPSFFAKYN